MSLYELDQVKQVLEGRTVLDIRHLKLKEGASYALLGPNGCGKTTLLHILAFLRKPAAGRILFRGQSVNWGEKNLCGLRRQVVLVEQHPIMFSTTVLKNVEYGLKMRGVDRYLRREKAVKCLDRVGMKDFAHRPAYLLSGGETQRVAIARALACEPKVLLFDEPTASVDAQNQSVIESVIQNIRREEGITVIFSTHKRMEAARLGENRIFMFEGKITGPGGENLLSGTIVRRDGKSICLIDDKSELEVDDQRPGPCRIMIKPEGVKVYSLDHCADIPGENLLFGRVLQMTAEEDWIQVLFDAGFPLRTRITRKEVASSGIVAGDEVRVQIPAGAVQVRRPA